MELLKSYTKSSIYDVQVYSLMFIIYNLMQEKELLQCNSLIKCAITRICKEHTGVPMERLTKLIAEGMIKVIISRAILLSEISLASISIGACVNNYIQVKLRGIFIHYTAFISTQMSSYIAYKIMVVITYPCTYPSWIISIKEALYLTVQFLMISIPWFVLSSKHFAYTAEDVSFMWIVDFTNIGLIF